MMRRPFLVLAALAAASVSAWAQGTVLQGGPWTPGHVPMYVGQGSSQPVVQDAGPAGGGAVGVGLSELGLTIRGVGTPPYTGGTGEYGTNLCDRDAPLTNPTGYHYLCFSPNAQGGGLIAYGAAGGAANLPLNFIINGVTYGFPFTSGGSVGPSTSIVNNVACWNNTIGTLLSDCGPGGSALPHVPTATLGTNTTQAASTAFVAAAIARGVIGPSSSIANNVACWDNTIGTLLSDCGAGGSAIPHVPTAALGTNTTQVASTAFVAAAFARAAPSSITSLVLYVATTGSNSSNNCLTSGTPCLTLQYALDQASQYVYNTGGTPLGVTIQVADGTYVTEAAFAGPALRTTTIQVTGNASDRTLVKLVCAGAAKSIVSVADYGGITLSNLTLDGNSTASCVGALARNAIFDLYNIQFNNFDAGTPIIGTNGADINLTGPLAFGGSGNAAAAISLNGESHITSGDGRIIILTPMTVTSAFFQITESSTLHGAQITFSGAGYGGSTGPQCLVLTSSHITTVFANAVPGTANTCVQAPGAQIALSANSLTNVAAGATAYIGPAGQNATELNAGLLTPIAGTFRNLRVFSASPPGAGQTFIVTLRIGGADQTVTCTISGAVATSCSDTTNFSQVAIGSVYSVKAVSSGGATASLIMWALEYDIP